MARLVRRLDRLEEPPPAEVSQQAMQHLTDRELELIVGWGRRAVAAAQAGEKVSPPTEEVRDALAHHASLCNDIIDGYAW